MSIEDKPNHDTVVVGVDYSALGELALDRALDWARAQARAEVHVVNVAQGYGPLVAIEVPTGPETLSLDEAAATLRKYVEQRVEAFEAQHGTLQLAHLVAHMRVGSPAHEIAQLATDLEAELVIVGTHGRRGISRLLLGSVAEAIVRLAPCSVEVVRPRQVPHEPKIEAACPRCIEARKSSGGQQLWCEQHSEKHGRPHTYHYQSKVWSGTRHSEIP